MDRRGFLRFLGLGAAAAVAAPYVPTRTYSFLGGIYRPRPQDVIAYTFEPNKIYYMMQDSIHWTLDKAFQGEWEIVEDSQKYKATYAMDYRGLRVTGTQIS